MDEPLNALELNAVYLIHVSESTSPSNYPLPSKKKKTNLQLNVWCWIISCQE